MEANKFVLVHQNSIGASFGLNALSGKKEKEKEENKLDLENEENEVASTIDMIIE